MADDEYTFDATAARAKLGRTLAPASLVPLFVKPTIDWDEPLNIDAEVKQTPTQLHLTIRIDDKRYHWIDGGTDEHEITAKDGGNLVFPAERVPPKTVGLRRSPTVRRPDANLVKGNVVVPVVQHPGIEEQNLFEKAAKAADAVVDRALDDWFASLLTF